MELKLKIVLRRLLKEHSVSLRSLAKLTGIKPSTLSGWANGVSPRDLSEVLTCARHFEISLEKLLFDVDPSPTTLEDLLSEEVFNGYLKVKIERVITNKPKERK